MAFGTALRIIFRLALSIHILTLNYAIAFPASTPTGSGSGNILTLPSNLTANPKPPGTPQCDKDLGKVFYNDCNAAIALVPHDPIGLPVTRNFYTATKDVSHDMPNVRVPLYYTSGKSHSNAPINTITSLY